MIIDVEQSFHLQRGRSTQHAVVHQRDTHYSTPTTNIGRLQKGTGCAKAIDNDLGQVCCPATRKRTGLEAYLHVRYKSLLNLPGVGREFLEESFLLFKGPSGHFLSARTIPLQNSQLN